MLLSKDPSHMPGSQESPADRFKLAAPLAGTAGQAYVEKRGVPLQVAEAARVRFDADFGGRPAVLAPLLDCKKALTGLHGRYLHTVRGQEKMLTFGTGTGVISVLDGWCTDPLIMVEGLFDALSLATCNVACIASIGRWAPWLPEVTAGRVTWLGFDASKPGEADVKLYADRLPGADIRRLPPPPRCKDWSTALVKRGPDRVSQWIDSVLATTGGNMHV